MNFFKSSFFTDLKLQDVLAFSQEEDTLVDSSISRSSESLQSSAQGGLAFSNAEDTQDLRSGALISSDSEDISSESGSAGAGSASHFSVSKDQEEEASRVWSLGTLVKSLTSKSEGIIQAYRKDLEEFGSGLKKETQLIAEVAAHAVKDLPTSLESGAYKAQESIETVGQVVEEFSSSVWRGTVDLIAQGKEAVLKIDDDESCASGVAPSSFAVSRYDSPLVSISGGKYSRFEAQLRAMQHDSSTFCEEPNDLADYTAWKSMFTLSDKKEDIDALVTENTYFKELLLRFVPNVVSEDIFWMRYFYRLHKLQQTEEARADLVKRASALEEEDLSWDTEEELEEHVQDEQSASTKVEEAGKVPKAHVSMEGLQASNPKVDLGAGAAIEVSPELQVGGYLGTTTPSKSLAEEEDDLGWEVPEDVEESSSNDGKRSSNSEASWEVPDVPREEIRKRVSAQEDEEEDLSWDVDDGADDTK